MMKITCRSRSWIHDPTPRSLWNMHEQVIMILLWILYFICDCVCLGYCLGFPLKHFAHLLGRADLLAPSCVTCMFSCVFVTSNMVPWVRCGIWFIDTWSLPSFLLLKYMFSLETIFWHVTLLFKVLCKTYLLNHILCLYYHMPKRYIISRRI